jgi:hypothetical protein
LSFPCGIWAQLSVYVRTLRAQLGGDLAPHDAVVPPELRERRGARSALGEGGKCARVGVWPSQCRKRRRRHSSPWSVRSATAAILEKGGRRLGGAGAEEEATVAGRRRAGWRRTQRGHQGGSQATGGGRRASRPLTATGSHKTPLERTRPPRQ